MVVPNMGNEVNQHSDQHLYKQAAVILFGT